MERMLHAGMDTPKAALLQRSDRRRAPALLPKIPICKQFSLMQFRPGLNQSLLPLRKPTGNERNGEDGKHGNVLLIIGVKMSQIVPFRRFGKHADDNAVKT